MHAYVCQPDRTFQAVQYVGFYTNGQVLPLVARIIDVQQRVIFERGRHEGRIGEIVDKLLDLDLREPSFEGKVFLLSAPEDVQTIRLDNAVVNDLRSASGRVAAFTQGQRYVRLEELTKATRTSELVAEGP